MATIIGEVDGIPIPMPFGLNNNKATVLAPWLYGSIMGSVCVGVLLMQTALYYSRYPNDRLYYKVTVGLLTFLSLISWGATMAILDHHFIKGYGSILAMHAMPRWGFVPIAVPAFSGTISQAFFATRIYRLSAQKRWLGCLLLALITTSFGAGIASIVTEPKSGVAPFNGSDLLLFRLFVPDVDSIFNKVITSIQVFLWTQAATDLILSGLLVYYLTRERKKGDPLMGSTLRKVLVMGLTTGGITAIFSLAEEILVLSSIWSNNVNMGLTLILAHVYSLVCISSLNVRRAIGKHGKGSSGSHSGLATGRTMSIHAASLHEKGSMSAFVSPVEKPSLASLRAAASRQPYGSPLSGQPYGSPLSAGAASPGAPPYAHLKRPAPPKLNTRDIWTGPNDRFDSAHTLETGQSNGSSLFSPGDYKSSSAYPVTKGDAAELVTMPRFSYLNSATSTPGQKTRRERARARQLYNGQTPI